jgi:hypothetical protein
VGESGFGVDRCVVAPLAWTVGFGAGLTGGNGAPLTCATTPGSVAEGVGAGIGVGSGGGGAVAAPLESETCGAVAGSAAVGVLTSAAGDS